MEDGLDVSPESMEYFELPQRRVPVNIRVPESLKEELQAIVRLWRVMAVARGKSAEDAEKEIDLTYVCERLLRVGTDGVWAQAVALAGLEGMPTSDEEWAKLEKAIFKNATKK